jgi:hypothetical protein
LDHNPVKIYHWVRNNLEWLPTWGAWQDAELTLSARRGNAVDSAGLLIALLRASGIPARYAQGTIELSAERFANWVGDFATVEAAWDYASAGGIPTTAVTSGGKITRMRLEHVWVEAAIDFEPSRGAKNRIADTWVALDPSYQQYEYLTGLDAIAVFGQNVSPRILDTARQRLTQTKTTLESQDREALATLTREDLRGTCSMSAHWATSPNTMRSSILPLSPKGPATPSRWATAATSTNRTSTASSASPAPSNPAGWP